MSRALEEFINESGCQMEQVGGGYAEGLKPSRLCKYPAAEYVHVDHLRAWYPGVSAKEKLAQWMISHSYATGHGDTIDDLLSSLDSQLASREGEAARPIASVTGYHSGNCVVEPIDRAVLLPVGMALYSGGGNERD